MAEELLGTAPSQPFHAATKKYVDDKVATVAGGAAGIPVFVQTTDPALSTSYVWYQVDQAGAIVQVWVNYAAPANLISSTTLRNASNSAQITAQNASVAGDSSSFYSGGSSIKLTPSGTGVYPYWYFTNYTDGAPVTPGQQYTAIGRLLSATTQAYSAVIVWVSSTGSALGQTVGTSTSCPAGTWTQCVATATAPANAAYALVQFQATNPINPADTVNVDEYGINAGTSTVWSA